MDRTNTASRGILLDLDGTLANTLTDLHIAVNAALAGFSLPPQPLDAVRRFVGDGVKLLCERAMHGARPDQLDTMVERVLEEYRLHDLDHTVLYDGVPAMLDALTARGIPLAVLTNKPQGATDRIIGALCSRWPFVAVEGYRIDERKKPDPRTALAIAEQMGAPPQQVWMVGDSLPDIQTGRNAGMVTVAVTWGFRDREELEAARPDHIIDEPMELLSLL
ncbi:MAG: HAD family hydrolase [Phycisphaerae bacterium]|nr:HAD family hydrolase [Phycisphaerae bacterium]